VPDGERERADEEGERDDLGDEDAEDHLVVERHRGRWVGRTRTREGRGKESEGVGVVDGGDGSNEEVITLADG
jgi:hypothetical protein